jgi:putative MATE family efflux protein
MSISPEEPVHLHKTTQRLGTDPLGKLLLRLSLPSIVSMVAISLYNLVDTFWVAKLGYRAVAALTVVLPFFILTYAVGVGTGIGVAALTSRRFGERKVEEANIVTGQVLFLSIALGCVLALVINFFPTQILILCGATPDILDFGKQYLTIVGLGMPFTLLNLISRNVYQASGDSVRPMIFIIISQVWNAIAAPFLIFGWGIFPELGVAGAALAALTANLIGAVLPLVYIAAGKTAYRIRLRHCIPKWSVIVDIYQVGLPSMLMTSTEGVVFALFNHVISGFGSLALAAIGIATRISDLAFMPILGTANGLLPIVGFSLGAKLWPRLWGAVKNTALWLVLFMALATLFLEIFTAQVVGIFNNNPELLAIAVPGMRIFCSTFIFIGPTIIFITTFQGLSKGKDAMFLSLARQFIFFVPGLYLLSAYIGLTGVWVAMPVSDFLGFVIASFWLWREYRTQKAANPAASEVSIS